MRKLKYIASALFISLAVSSCNLDKFPENSISRDQAFEKVSDAKNWDTNFYAQLRARVYGYYWYVSDIQADQLNATLDFGNSVGAPHRWSDDFNSDNYEIRDQYLNYYSALKNVNLSIEKFPTIPTTTEAEKKELNQYLGDAYLTRAYYNFKLANRYAKAYDAKTADTDLGIPLVLTYDIYELPSRSTLKQTYDQILLDLGQAKTLLAGVAGTPGSKYYTIDVVNALEARIKLYMGDWAGAKAAADAVIATNKYVLYNTAETVKAMWAEDKTNEDILISSISLVEGPNQNSVYHGYEAATKTYRPSFVPTQGVINTFEDSDFRKNVYFKMVDLYQGGKSYPGYIVSKYPGNPALQSSTASNVNTPKIFRIAESYLISSEAAFQAGNSAAALTRLNELRVARGLKALVGVTGDALLREIKSERTRELAFEGFRLDDLKRWKEGFTRKDPQNLDFLSTGEGYTTKTVQANDNKFVWGIPGYDMILNKNLVQNPGW